MAKIYKSSFYDLNSSFVDSSGNKYTRTSANNLVLWARPVDSNSAEKPIDFSPLQTTLSYTGTPIIKPNSRIGSKLYSSLVNPDGGSNKMNVGSATLWNSIIGTSRIDNRTEFSISLLIKPAVTISGFTGILDFGGRDLRLYMHDDGHLRFGVRFSGEADANWQAPNAFNDSSGNLLDRWYHVVVTYDYSSTGNNPLIYIDGQLKGNSSPHTSPVGSWNGISGADTEFGAGSANDFEGEMTDLAIWTRILPASEVSAIYNGIYNGASDIGSGFTKNPIRTRIRDLDNSSGKFPIQLNVTDGKINASKAFDDNTAPAYKTSYPVGTIELLGIPVTGENFVITGSDGTRKVFEIVRSAGGQTIEKAVQVSLTQNPLLNYDFCFGSDTKIRQDLSAEFGKQLHHHFKDDNSVRTSNFANNPRDSRFAVMTQTWAAKIESAASLIANTINGVMTGSYRARALNNKIFIESLTVPASSTAHSLGVNDITFDPFFEMGRSFPKVMRLSKNFSSFESQIDLGSQISSADRSKIVDNLASLPTLIGPGVSSTANSFFSNTPEHFQQITSAPFDDSRISIPLNDPFFVANDEPGGDFGRGVPLSSKSQIVINLVSSENNPIFYSTGSSGTIHSDVAADEQGSGMAYWNSSLNRWEMKGLNLPGFQNRPYLLDQKLTAQDGKTYFYNSASCLGFAPDFGHDSIATELAQRNSVGQPIIQFGFPMGIQYNATSSQELKMSDYISSPFVIEKISLEISGAFGLTSLNTGSLDQGFIQKQFFILNQFTDGDNPHYSGDSFEYPIIVGDPSQTSPIHQHANGEFKNYGDRELVGFSKINFVPASKIEKTPLEDGTFRISVDRRSPFQGFPDGMTNATIKDISDRIVFYDAREHELNGPSPSHVTFSGSFRFSLTPSVSSISDNNSLISGKGDKSSTEDISADCSVVLSNPFGGAGLQGQSSGRHLEVGIFSNDFSLTSSHNSALDGNKFKRQIRTKQRKFSPYLVKPSDRLIFGWQNHPIAPNEASDVDRRSPSHSVSKADEFVLGEHLVDRIKSVKMTIFGSHVVSGKSVTFSNDQQASSDAVHYPIGNSPVLDQHEVYSLGLLSGSFSDALFFGDLISKPHTVQNNSLRVGNRGRISSIAKTGGGLTGSLQRTIRCTDNSRVYLDSLVPSPGTVIVSTYDPESVTTTTVVCNGSSPAVRNVISGDPTFLLTNRIATSVYRDFFSQNPDSLTVGPDGLSTVHRAVASNGTWLNTIPGNTNLNFDVQKTAELAGRIGYLEPETATKANPSKTGVSSKGAYNSPVSSTSKAKSFNHIGKPVRFSPAIRRIAVDLNIGANLGALTPDIRALTIPLRHAGVNVPDSDQTAFGGGDRNAGEPVVVGGSDTDDRQLVQTAEAVAKLFYGFGMIVDYGGLPVLPISENQFVVQVRGFKTGIMNVPEINPSNHYRRSSYGQFRDLIEQHPETAFINPANNQHVDPPVRVVFRHRTQMNDGSPFDTALRRNLLDPERTNTQNLDQFASSSLPYFDNSTFERFSVPPDYLDSINVIDDGGNVIVDE